MIAIWPFSQENNSLAEEAKRYIKSHKKELIEKFASDVACPPTKQPSSFFMAGTPGAGKTETAISLIQTLGVPALHIDPDEIKKWIPGYNGKNSQELHGASVIGIEKLYDYAIAKHKSVIFDATFSDYEISQKNIQRSLKHDRIVWIFYIYQNPELSWKFTLKREEDEGRHVPRAVFLHALENAGRNVVRIKREFGDKVKIYLVEKNLDRSLEKTRMNIGADELENFLQRMVKLPTN